jgi:acyl carrier protein
MVIERLGLETEPEIVSDNQPLFGRGLEMDSLDTLEIVVMVNNEYDVAISDDDIEAFGSINALVDFIEDRQA